MKWAPLLLALCTALPAAAETRFYAGMGGGLQLHQKWSHPGVDTPFFEDVLSRVPTLAPEERWDWSYQNGVQSWKAFLGMEISPAVAFEAGISRSGDLAYQESFTEYGHRTRTGHSRSHKIYHGSLVIKLPNRLIRPFARMGLLWHRTQLHAMDGAPDLRSVQPVQPAPPSPQPGPPQPPPPAPDPPPPPPPVPGSHGLTVRAAEIRNTGNERPRFSEAAAWGWLYGAGIEIGAGSGKLRIEWERMHLQGDRRWRFSSLMEEDQIDAFRLSWLRHF